ncbi:hypothetical protein [Streptomyces coeruleorubidus]|uniref:Uncharacterized protein n=1 Tax=Streptomyces coeruleorubidus TaxID=116188 RepID=A0ABZ0KRG9_STRC4|nr:hypothetical protein [Streptomyces coeruleorubidus]WOT40588.1 hypothetical protein R5U08_41565 [Streptomyces coeruleorubidus]
MTQTLPSLTTEAAALSVAGAGLRRYEMGSALIGAGADATVVILEPRDNPEVSGVQDSTDVLLRGDAVPALHSRFDFWEALPLHLFVRLDRGCLPLGTARCRGRSSAPADFDRARLELDRPLTREMLDAVRPVPAPGPVPGVDWVDQVETDPIRALESFVLGWFPAEEAEPTGKESTAGEPDDLPEALAAFHRLARLRPAVYRFRNPVLKQPRRASGPLGGRLVFAVDGEGTRDWSIPWPPQELGEVDPRVWLTEDPFLADPETILEEEPLSRFLLQYTLYEAMNAALYQAWTYCMPTARLAPLWSMLCPVPLSPFLPAYTAEKFFVAPGLLTRITSDENEAAVAFAALHRATLTPLLEHGFRWSRFDG